MEECFEFEGHKLILDYGLYIDGEYASYGNVIEKMNPEITWKYEDAGCYQGDWFAVGHKDFGYFFHNGSYGSCSVCDWLQGIDTEDGAIEFLKEMKKIIPIGDADSAIEYLEKEKQNTWGDNREALEKLQSWVREECIESQKTIASIEFRTGKKITLTKTREA